MDYLGTVPEFPVWWVKKIVKIPFLQIRKSSNSGKPCREESSSGHLATSIILTTTENIHQPNKELILPSIFFLERLLKEEYEITFLCFLIASHKYIMEICIASTETPIFSEKTLTGKEKKQIFSI